MAETTPPSSRALTSENDAIIAEGLDYAKVVVRETKANRFDAPKTSLLADTVVLLNLRLIDAQAAAMKAQRSMGAPASEDAKDAARWRAAVEQAEFPVQRRGQWLHVLRPEGRIIEADSVNEIMDKVIAARSGER